MRHIKKLLFCFLVLVFTLMLLIMPAFADDASPPGDIMGSYMSWEFLGTMSGATAAVLLIVQFLKAPLDRLWKIPTRFIAYLFSLLILFGVDFFTGVISPERIPLLFLNAIIVTVSAMGAYAATFQKLEGKNVT